MKMSNVFQKQQQLKEITTKQHKFVQLAYLFLLKCPSSNPSMPRENEGIEETGEVTALTDCLDAIFKISSSSARKLSLYIGSLTMGMDTDPEGTVVEGTDGEGTDRESKETRGVDLLASDEWLQLYTARRCARVTISIFLRS